MIPVKKVEGKQVGRSQYDLNFLLDLTSEVIAAIPGADRLKIRRFEFRSKPWASHHTADGEHKWDPVRRESTLLIRSNIGAESIAMSIAHELSHALQFQSGRLRHEGYRGWIWEGVFFPKETPVRNWRWEAEAADMETYGTGVYEFMQRQGRIPLSSLEKTVERFKAIGVLPRNPLVMEEFDGVPDNMVLPIIRDVKSGKISEDRAREIIAAAKLGASAGTSRNHRALRPRMRRGGW